MHNKELAQEHARELMQMLAGVAVSKNISIPTLADLLSTDVGNLRKTLAGVHYPKLSSALRIAKALNCSAILRMDDTIPPPNMPYLLDKVGQLQPPPRGGFEVGAIALTWAIAEIYRAMGYTHSDIGNIVGVRPQYLTKILNNGNPIVTVPTFIGLAAPLGVALGFQDLDDGTQLAASLSDVWVRLGRKLPPSTN